MDLHWILKKGDFKEHKLYILNALFFSKIFFKKCIYWLVWILQTIKRKIQTMQNVIAIFIKS